MEFGLEGDEKGGVFRALVGELSECLDESRRRLRPIALGLVGRRQADLYLRKRAARGPSEKREGKENIYIGTVL